MGVQLNQLRKSLMYGVNVGCTGGCLGERLNGIQEVSGSIPLISTTQSSYSLNCKSFYYTKNFEGGLPYLSTLRCILNNKELVKYFYETIVSLNLLDKLSEYISENCILKNGEDTFSIGLNGMMQHLMALRQTYPDYTMRILRQYSDGDYVISEFVMQGTHKGDFMGIKPSNKVLEIVGVDIDKVIAGKIVEHGGAANTFECFWQNKLIKPV